MPHNTYGRWIIMTCTLMTSVSSLLTCQGSYYYSPKNSHLEIGKQHLTKDCYQLVCLIKKFFIIS